MSKYDHLKVLPERDLTSREQLDFLLDRVDLLIFAIERQKRSESLSRAFWGLLIILAIWWF